MIVIKCFSLDYFNALPYLGFQFKYNSEEQLIAVINEKGETYKFIRDVKGNVKKEITFDGVIRRYKRDQAGQVKFVKRPKGRWTEYSHDKMGRVLSVKHHDKTYDEFKYNENGALIEAKNQDVTLKFERDATGRIIKEMQDEYVVESSYNDNVHDLC